MVWYWALDVLHLDVAISTFGNCGSHKALEKRSLSSVFVVGASGWQHRFSIWIMVRLVFESTTSTSPETVLPFDWEASKAKWSLCCVRKHVSTSKVRCPILMGRCIDVNRRSPGAEAVSKTLWNAASRVAGCIKTSDCGLLRIKPVAAPNFRWRAVSATNGPV